jgi:diguanylate cyclase (GGDEF)-like protein
VWAWLQRCRPQRLSSRIVALFLGLLLLVQLTAFGLVQWSIDSNARQQLTSDLARAERLWNQQLEQRSQLLKQSASVLASDYGFRAAAASGDTETLGSALDNQGRRLGATVTAMLAPDLQLRALGESADRHALQALGPVVASLAGPDSGLVVLDGRPYQLVRVPMKAPQLVGYVVMGFPLDDALLASMKPMLGADVVLLTAEAGGVERVALSTLPADLAVLLAGRAGTEITLPRQGPQVLRSIAAAAPRRAAAGAASGGAAGTLRTVLLRSVDEAVAPYRELQARLAMLTLLGLLVAGAASVFTARRVTTPLRSLVRATEYMGQGDYSRALQHAQRHDEIGDLSRAFEQMRVSIAGHEQAIRQLAYWDRLTGLPNRAQFRDAVRKAIEQAAGASGSAHRGGLPPRPIAVVMLDLDRFKHVNDVLGYAFGDRLLQGVAERLLKQSVREGDMVARLSGDEFALLLPGTDEAAAVAVAERVADVFQLPMTLDDHTVDLAAGFGVACWPAHAADADTLINRAEVAMYSAKKKTGAAQVYDAGIDAGSARSLSLLSELRRAVEDDELRLFLQPKIELRTGALIGAESLVRWQHPTRGMVPPMDFIPFAEQTGFVRHLTLWMLEATAQQWQALSALGLKSVSVNLSTRDLLDQELQNKVERILRRHGMPHAALCLEITESAIMDEPQRALATLNALSAAGFKLSIDDFGTGYSSLAYLKRLPVNELKIDRSFVMAMEKDVDDAKIVRSTIDLAHNLGLTVVAEGVENVSVLRLLAELDCDQAQGYHMSRPLPAAEMVAFAERWQALPNTVLPPVTPLA